MSNPTTWNGASDRLDQTQLRTMALSMVRSVCGSMKHQYLSGPITGGKRYIDACTTALHTPSKKLDRAAGVIEANAAALKVKAEKIRLEEMTPVIEPGSFEVGFPGWGQPDYLALWEKVIAEHASAVRFLDGWEYSAGCAFEYLCALRHEVPTIDEWGDDLNSDKALTLLADAIAEIRTTTDGGALELTRLLVQLVDHHNAIFAFKE